MAETPLREPGDPAHSGTSGSPGDLGWVTAFDDPVLARAAQRAMPAKTFLNGPWPARALFALVGGALAAWVTIDVASGRLGESPLGLPPAVAPTAEAPVPTRTATPQPESTRPGSTPVAPAVPVPGGVRLPETCRELFGAGITKKLSREGLGLAAAVSDDGLDALPHEIGSADRKVRAVLAEVATMECLWLDDAGGKAAGILTAIGFAADTDSKAAQKRLSNLGMTRLEEHGGIRYFEESTDSTGRARGESHFFREDVWFATHWYGYGPRGYSAAMAQRVFK